MKAILGLNAYHADSSACILIDGKLVACVEEERFRRIKHWAGFPSESIRYCLSSAGISLDQVSRVAVNSNSGSNLGRKLGYILSHRPAVSLLLRKLRTRLRRSSIKDQLIQSFPEETFTGKISCVGHHLSHLASGYYAGPFDEAVSVSIDGFGDFASAAWGHARNGKIDVISQIWFPHSMGIFYQAITQYLGFPNYGDEYKVMGLASYGRPTYANAMRNIVKLADDGKYELNLGFFRHGREVIEYSWAEGMPVFETLYTQELEDLLGPARQTHEKLDQRHKDIARSAQWMYEQAFFHLLNSAYEHCGCKNLVLAGGCAMNSVANGRITSNAPFRNIYVQSAAGDAGGAVGAAFVAAAKGTDEGIDRGQMPHASWGPSFDDNEIAGILSSRGSDLDDSACTVTKIEAEGVLCTTVAQAIADGLVVGWFQGRMEWGPRALGNRSILGDPRRVDMKDILNLKIKRRESFRPFAPSILRDRVLEWFEQDDDVPFMMKVLQIRESKRSRVPAVTHVDGSGRVHTVTSETNPLFFKLIESFDTLTGIPIVLNTSFNENEPIVCRPEDALDCFIRTSMDLLVLGAYLIRRQDECIIGNMHNLV
jgi:carbamoyltransferase